MLTNMPDLKWTVRVRYWTWVYSFSRHGSVSWTDPNNGMSGNGRWRISGSDMTITWTNSTTVDHWDVPLDPNDARGKCVMGGETHELRAVARNFYLQPGDVVYSGKEIKGLNAAAKTAATVIYADEIRTGGTIAWVCRNPGAIIVNASKQVPEKYGGFKGKGLSIRGLGTFAIFPDEETGLKAVVSILRVYGKVTLRQAMRNYAPKGHGKNDPDKYAETLAKGLRGKGFKVTADDTYLTTFDDDQMMTLAKLITGVETSTPGTRYTKDSTDLPFEIRQRTTGWSRWAPTDDEVLNSYQQNRSW